MGLPAYLLGLPLLGGVALVFLLTKMMEQNSQPHQIEESNRPKPSRNIYIQNDLELCPICFEPMNPRKLQELMCGHKLLSECVKDLYKENITFCPLCRAKLIKKGK